MVYCIDYKTERDDRMEPTTQQVFGMRLALLRASHGMSQQQVANVLNLSRSTYSYYESGKCAPSLDTLRALIRLFCPTSPNFLLLMDQPVEEEKLPDVLHDGEVIDENRPLPVDELSKDEKQILAFYRVFSEAQKKKLLSVCIELAAAPFEEGTV